MSEESAKDICERYVAFIDILGFQTLIETKPLDEILNKIANVLSYVPVVSTLGHISVKDARYTPNEQFRAVHLCSFSDSFVIATKDSSRDSLNSIIAATFLLSRGLFMGGLPVRGSICVGEAGIIPGTDHIIGKAVIEAITLEREQAWFGIMFSKHVLTGQNRRDYLHSSIQPLVVRYSIPFKQGRTEPVGHALNWRYNIFSQIGIAPLLPKPRDAYPEDAIKVENTLKFLRFLRETGRSDCNVNRIPSGSPHLFPALIRNDTTEILGTQIQLEHGDEF